MKMKPIVGVLAGVGVILWVLVLFTIFGREGQGGVVFKPIQIVPAYHESYEGHFLFINRTGKNIVLDGYKEPEDGVFYPGPSAVSYEIEEDGKWISGGGIAHDSRPRYFNIKRDKEYEFIIGLWPIFDKGRSVNARVKVGGYASESFVPDWDKDRRRGHFAAAKKEEMNILRRLLLEAGFKSELLEGDHWFYMEMSYYPSEGHELPDWKEATEFYIQIMEEFLEWIKV